MNQLPDHLRNRSRRRTVLDNVHEGLGAAAPPYVSIEGTSFTLVDSDGEEIPVATSYFDCVIIDALATPSRVYWGRDYVKGVKLPAECFSDNGIGASKNAVTPQSARCDTCPQNVWGSAISKVTGKPIKACTVVKKLAVLAYASGDKGADGVYAGNLAAEFPFLLRVPVMSHDNLRAYSDRFRGQDFDVSDVVTRVTFVHGAVGMLDFLPLAFVDPDTNAGVDKILDSKVTDQLVGRNDQPVEALPKPATAEAVEKPKPAAPRPPAEPMQIASPATAKAGRGRPRKSAAAAGQQAGPFAAPRQEAASRNPQQDAAPQQAHEAAAVQRKAPFIVSNPGSPPHDVEQALDSLFNIKTGP